LVKEEQLIIPVTIPGRETTVSISIARREATIVTRETGLADALVTLHHNQAGFFKSHEASPVYDN
jgi:hypothetical protein